jgi:hypothetical protein
VASDPVDDMKRTFDEHRSPAAYRSIETQNQMLGNKQMTNCLRAVREKIDAGKSPDPAKRPFVKKPTSGYDKIAEKRG